MRLSCESATAGASLATCKFAEQRQVPARHRLPGLFIEIAGLDGEGVCHLAGSLRNAVQRAGTLAGAAGLLPGPEAGVASDLAGPIATATDRAAVACHAGGFTRLACSAIFPNGFVCRDGLLGCRVITPLFNLSRLTAASTTIVACRLPLALALEAFRATLAIAVRTSNFTVAVAVRACDLAAPLARRALPCVTDARDAADAIVRGERFVRGRRRLCLCIAPALNPLHDLRAFGRDLFVDRAFHAGLGGGVADAGGQLPGAVADVG